MVDPITNMPIIILRDQEGQKVLPIWVGVFEANAIALQIENIQTPRPMTHDLLRNVIQDLQASVDKIVVCDLKENTFYAVIHLVDVRRSGRHRRTARATPSHLRLANARADPGRRTGDRQRQDRRPVEREAGQRTAATMARTARPGRPRQIQNVGRPADNFAKPLFFSDLLHIISSNRLPPHRLSLTC